MPVESELLNAKLDEISKKIKEVEDSLKSNPFEFSVPFTEIGENCYLGWLFQPYDEKRKRRLMVVFDDLLHRPLIECKLGIRIHALRAMLALQKKGAEMCGEFLIKLKSIGY